MGEEEDASGPRGRELRVGRPRRPLVRRRRGGRFLDSSNCFHFYHWEGKYRSFQVRQARVLQIGHIIVIVVRGMSV